MVGVEGGAAEGNWERGWRRGADAGGVGTHRTAKVSLMFWISGEGEWAEGDWGM